MKQDGYYFYKRRKRYSEESFHEIVHWGIGIFISILFAFILVYFLGMNVNVDGNSMAPGLIEGQRSWSTDSSISSHSQSPGMLCCLFQTATRIPDFTSRG